jgi:FeS assembly SUF system regulator
MSKLADYATVLMVYLARQDPQLSNAREIALRTHIAVPTVSKLLKRLTAAKLLISVRGVQGGYRLQRQPAHISAAEIIYAVDEYRGLTECSMQPNACSLQAVCNIQGNWRLISQSIEAALDSVSLAALAKPVLPNAARESIEYFVTGVRRDENQ